MVACDCSVTTAGEVVLVQAVCSSSAPTPRRVALAAHVDGPIWPPRSNGVPERDWDDGEVTAVVPPAGRLAVGFATPGTPADPPVEVVDVAPADGEESALDDDPDAVVRALGDGRPPRDAVPEPVAASRPSDGSDDGCADGSDDGCADGSDDGCADGTDTRSESAETPVTPPDPVATWLDDVERRVDAAESGGDTAGVAGESARLSAVAERAAALAVRCGALDP